jgi:hypothetical protein
MNKVEYKRFMRSSRKIMKQMLEEMRNLNEEFYMDDNEVKRFEEMYKMITWLVQYFYGRENCTIAERKTFIEMYMR